MKSNISEVMDLYSKEVSYKFNESELGLIRAHLKKSRNKFRCKYAFYKKESSKNLYIAFIIDQMHNSPRKSAAENVWEYFCDRPIADEEFEEFVKNFGCDRRRFVVWYYRDIEALIEEDKLYGVHTPQKFIEECRQRGYSGNYQTRINFDDL